MAYERMNLQNNVDKWSAEHVAHMEAGIIANEQELKNKQPKGNYLTEHQKIKTINGQSLIGEGNIVIEGGGGGNVDLDTTLTQSGKAADAKAVGDAINQLSEEKADKTVVAALAKEVEAIKSEEAGENLWDFPKRTLVKPTITATKDTVPNYTLSTSQYCLTGTRAGLIYHGSASGAASVVSYDSTSITLTPKETGVGLFMPIKLTPGNEIRLRYTKDHSYGLMSLTWYDSDKKYVGNMQFQTKSDEMTYDETFVVPNYPNFVLTVTANGPALPNTITFSTISMVDITATEEVYNANTPTMLDAYVAWKSGEHFPITFIGDSTYAGVGSGEDAAFPAVLQNLLREECGDTVTVYNSSFSGAVLNDGIAAFNGNFGADGTYADTKIVFIGYGINDRLNAETYAEYEQHVYTSVETLVNKCRGRGIQPIIVTSQATCECGVSSKYPQYPLRTAEAITTCANGAKKAVAGKYGVPLIDLNRYTELFMLNSTKTLAQIIPDHVHFSAIGNEYEAGVMFKYLVPRTISYDGNGKMVVSLASQNLISSIPDDKISFGGDYKVYASYEKGDASNAKIVDAYIFVENHPTTLSVTKKNAGSSTYVMVNGTQYDATQTESVICNLDLGLHHLEVYTGESNAVDFGAIVVGVANSND